MSIGIISFFPALVFSLLLLSCSARVRARRPRRMVSSALHPSMAGLDHRRNLPPTTHAIRARHGLTS